MFDPEYLRLYRRYAKAIRAYESALKKRRQLRARRWSQKGIQAESRRPVGSTPGRSKAAPSSTGSGRGYSQSEMRIYMGEILGWARLVGISTPAPQSPDADSQFDSQAFDDRLNLNLYWNAKNHYLKCKKEFFDYVRRGQYQRGGKRPSRGYRKNLARARGYNEYAANLQFLGIVQASEAALENARREVETACYKLWDNYRDNPNDKQVIKELIRDGLVEAQLHGIDDSPIVIKITEEINHLVNSGKIGTK
jgi:hypothetical protein